jgi:hypothetical protein
MHYLTTRQKDLLYWRHKLQKGLLIESQQPAEEDMKLMSHYLYQLERFPHLETNSIRATKVNKLLESILSLDEIPREDEFQFRSRSKSLLERWNNVLRADEPSKDATVEASNNSYESQSESMDFFSEDEYDLKLAELISKSKASEKSE